MTDEQFVGYLDNIGLKYLLDNYIAKKTETAGALTEAKKYADDAVAALVNGAPETLDTLDELAAALKDNKDIVDVLNQSIGAKADKTALADHVNNKNNPHNVTAQQLNLAAVATSGSYGDLTNKPNIPTVGYAANGKNYPVELSNNQMYVNVPWTDTIYTLTKDKVVNALGYEPPTTDTNTTYSAATTSSDGLMSAADKAKLDGIVAGANKYTLPVASDSTLGGVRIGYTESGKNYPVRLDSNNKMYVYVPWEKGSSDITGTVQISQGGTGATDRKNALYNLAYLGTEPIKTAATDTTAKWTEIGSGYTFYLTSGLLNNQPSQYGLLINYAQNSEIFQIWNTQYGGPTYFRSGNGSGWADTGWRKVFDSANYPNGIQYGNAALDVSMNQTPIIWARNNGKTSWALERNGATQNAMAAHYYDEDGNWTTSGFLLDHQNFTTYVTPAAIGAAESYHLHTSSLLQPGSIEMTPGSGSTHGGFIDFHYGGSTSDYTSRIIEYDSGVLSINEHAYIKLGTVTGGIWNGSAIPVANGGTGATNAATARANLGITSANIGAVPTSRTINGQALSDNITLSAANIGAAPAVHSHANIVNGTVSFFAGISQTALLTAQQNDKYVWAIERSGATYKSLTAHYYNESGTWEGSGVLLDSGNYTAYITPAAIGAVTASSLATVATSGNYNDLSNKPTIPTTMAWGSITGRPTLITATSWNASTGVLQLTTV